MNDECGMRVGELGMLARLRDRVSISALGRGDAHVKYEENEL